MRMEFMIGTGGVNGGLNVNNDAASRWHLTTYHPEATYLGI